jgi:hypothetical protein
MAAITVPGIPGHGLLVGRFVFTPVTRRPASHLGEDLDARHVSFYELRGEASLSGLIAGVNLCKYGGGPNGIRHPLQPFQSVAPSIAAWQRSRRGFETPAGFVSLTSSSGSELDLPFEGAAISG